MQPGEELVERPFERLIEAGQLITYRHDGFWAPMDTLKDMQKLEALYDAGNRRGRSGVAPGWAKMIVAGGADARPEPVVGRPNVGTAAHRRPP